MALDLCLATGDPRRPLEPAAQLDRSLDIDLPATLSIAAPMWKRLADAVYDSPRLDPQQAAALGVEARRLRTAWIERQRTALARSHGVTARDPAIRDRILDQLAAGVEDAVRDELDRVVQLCDAAAAAGAGIVGVSD